MLAGALAVTLAGVPFGAMAQDRGAQTTPDEQLLLVSKDINDERWAIGLNPATGIATGNVFPSGGGAPSFVWCRTKNATLRSDPRETQYTLECFGASPCADLDCQQSPWTFLRDVPISGSFFLPP